MEDSKSMPQIMQSNSNSKNGNVLIINPKNSSIVVNNNNISLSTNNHENKETQTSNTKLSDLIKCVLCENKDIVALSNCGCSLCKNDNEAIILNKIICPTHNKEMKRGIQFPKKDEIISHLDDKGFQKEEKICPVCKVSAGTCSFNCKCNEMVCAKCFNDIMNIYNYRRCPICKMEYKPPIKKSKKKKKNKKVKKSK